MKHGLNCHNHHSYITVLLLISHIESTLMLTTPIKMNLFVSVYLQLVSDSRLHSESF